MINSEPDDEETLINQAKINRQVFGVLYDRYVDRIYAFAYHQTGNQALAHDVTAATFEKALRGLDRYEPRGFRFSAWLYRIARNELVQQHRKSRWFIPFTGWHIDHETDYHAFDGPLEQQEQHALLMLALSKLSFDDRTLLTLRFLEELSSEQVAEIMGYSLPNLYVRIHRALKRIRRQLEQIDTVPEVHQKETLHV